MRIKEAQNIYMVGIGGVGVLSLSIILKKMGKDVRGVDSEKFHSSDVILDENTIPYERGFDKKHISDDIDLLITTAAHGGLENEEVVAAREKGIAILSFAEAVGEVMQLFDTRVSVCGTHGKTTTSGMGAVVADELDIPSGYMVGALKVSGMDSGGYTGNKLFIAEADEYVVSTGTDHRAKFMLHCPNVIICTGIEHDHVDIYPDLASVKRTFGEFFAKLGEHGLLIYNRDDENAHEAATKAEVDTISYGFSSEADVRIMPADEGYTVVLQDGSEVPLQLSVPGKHNISNATSILILMTRLGYTSDEIIEALENFSSTKLRFEKVFESDRYVAIVDYGHHPTEMRVTIEAAREKYPGRRIVVFFQPHSFARTDAFKDEFIEELSKADKGILLDIYGSTHELAQFDVRSDAMIADAKKSGIENVEYVQNDTVPEKIAHIVQEGDVLIFMGAGDFFATYGEDILKQLS